MNELQPTVITGNQSVHNLGSVARMDLRHMQVKAAGNFCLTADNSGGGSSKTYIIGDSARIVQNSIAVPEESESKTWQNFSGNTLGVLTGNIFRSTMGYAPVMVQVINICSTSQLAWREFVYFYQVDIDGTVNISKTSAGATRRNSQFDTTIQTLVLTNPFTLSGFNAMGFVVPDGVSIDVYFGLAASANRYGVTGSIKMLGDTIVR